MADSRLIPAGIRDISTLAFNEVIDRLGQIPLDQLLVYLVDNITASALPHLIEQFHVTGWEGGAQAITDEARRELIKRAIELHRYKGTPWAVARALEATGQRVRLTEWFDQEPPGAPYTALAEVEVSDRPLIDGAIAAIEAAINEWKPVRAQVTVRVVATTVGRVHLGACCFGGDVTTVYPYSITELTTQPGPALTMGIGLQSWMTTEVRPA